MKKLLLTILVLLFSTQLFSQVFNVTGIISSGEDKKPMAGVTVFAEYGKYNTITDEKGAFTLANLPITCKEIRCVFIGHNDLVVPIKNPGAKHNVGTLYMTENTSVIDEVVVTAAAPMAIQNGDTTQFNASAFKTNPDADADDLLAKMPGVVIEDGKVEVQGEVIKKVYVDGHEFFGGSIMEALKTIPADAIESIQIFDDLSDEEKETGITDSEPTKAINIVTKNKRDKNTILKTEGLAGFDTDAPRDFRYMAGGSLSLFSKENKFTVTAIANNINASSFGDNTDPSESQVDSKGSSMNNNQGVKVTQGGGLNFSRKVKKYEFSTSYTFNHVDNFVEKRSIKDFFAVEGSYDERIIDSKTSTNSTSLQHKVNMKVKWKITDKLTLTVSPEFRIQDYDYETTNLRSVTKDGDSVSVIKTDYEHQSTSLSAGASALLGYKFEKKNRGLSLSTSYSMSNTEFERTQIQDYKRTYSTSTQLWTYTDETDLTNKKIAQNGGSSNYKFKLSYSEPLADGHKIVVSASGNRTLNETQKTDDNYDYTTEDYTDPNETQYNHFNRKNYYVGGSTAYAYDGDGKSFDAGLNVNYINQTYTQIDPYESVTPLEAMEYQPFLSFRYRVPKKFYIRVYYKGNTELPDPSRMQNIVNDSNTSHLRLGNPNLKEGYKHSLFLFFNKSNVEKSTNFNTNLIFNSRTNYITSSTTEVEAGDQVTDTYVATEDALVSQSINMNGYYYVKYSASYSFFAKPIKSNINTGFNYSYVRSPSIYYQINYANIHTAAVRLGLSSNISENIDFNFYSSSSYNYTLNTVLSNSSYFNQVLHLSSNFIFGKNYVINSSFTWRYYDDSGSYAVWNLGIGRKFFKRRNAEARVVVYDLLNQNTNIQRYVRTSNIETQTSNALGRYVMLRLSYRFNTMSMTPKPKKIKTKNSRKISVEELKEISTKQENSGTEK